MRSINSFIRQAVREAVRADAAAKAAVGKVLTLEDNDGNPVTGEVTKVEMKSGYFRVWLLREGKEKAVPYRAESLPAAF